MNLSNLEQRKQYIEQLGKDFIQELRDAGLELSDKTLCRISPNNIEIGSGFIKPGCFDPSSYIVLSLKSKFFNQKEHKISVASTGSFAPSGSKEPISTWKLIHAGQLASKWDLVVPILDKYQKLINELMKIEVKQ